MRMLKRCSDCFAPQDENSFPARAESNGAASASPLACVHASLRCWKPFRQLPGSE